MSQLPDLSGAPAASPAPTRDGRNPTASTFHLVVISPSSGVNGPLHFPDIVATSSVKEVKAKIRDIIPSKPTDDGQRLIHHGRLLSRETETMLEVFGQEALGNGDTKTLHLVLRDAPPAPSPAAGPSRAPPILQQLQPRPQSTPINPTGIPGIPGQQSLPMFQHMQQHQALHQVDNNPHVVAQRVGYLQQETRRLHQDMIALEQRSRAIAATAQQVLNNQQPPGQPGSLPPHMMQAAVRNMIAQQQRDRAADGRQGVQDTGGLPTPSGQPQPMSGQASPNPHRPDSTTTYTREGVGPNGERYSITVNETNMTLPIGQPHSHHHHHPGQQGNQHPALDQLQAILRNADRFMAPPNLQNGQNNMERAASNPLPAPNALHPQPPRMATPAGVTSDTPTGTATPATTNNSPTPLQGVNLPSGDIPSLPTQGQPLNAHTQAFNAHSQALHAHAQVSNPPTVGHFDPVVYLLSSPTGPRALLLNNSDTFYTPRPSSRRRRPDENVPNVFRGGAAIQNPVPPAVGLPEFRNRFGRARRGHRHQENNNLNPANQAVPHANPGAGALGAQIGPMLWLILRLVGFVWFFTAGNSSWTRWFMVSGLAVVVFIINTGILNGIFEQLWGPIRRHVETLIPLAGPEAAQVPARNAAIPRALDAAERNDLAARGEPQEQGHQERRRRRGEPDPAQVAAHLLEQHRQRNAPGWLMTQIRRAEHAMLLFLASLVPGVGERHIAAREAEANAAEAERQRQIDAAAAAAAENLNSRDVDSEPANNGTGEGRANGPISDDISGESLETGPALAEVQRLNRARHEAENTEGLNAGDQENGRGH